MGLSELGVTFFKVGGHTHDGENSAKVDLSKYGSDDLTLIDSLITNRIQSLGSLFSNRFPEGIYVGSGGPGAVGSFAGGYTPPPTGLTLSTGVSQTEREVVFIDAIWSPPNPTTVATANQAVEYEVFLSKTPGTLGTDTNGATYLRVERVKTPQIRFSPVDAGQSYNVSVRGVNPLNIPSTTVGPETIVAAIDTSAPAVPVGIVATGSFKGVQVSWTENTEVDVRRGRGFYDVQITSAADTGFASPLQTVRVNATMTSFEGVATFTNYLVRVRAVDSSNNASAYSAGVAVGTTGIGVGDGDGTASIPWEQTFEQFNYADWNSWAGGSSGDFNRITGAGTHGGNVLRVSGTGARSLQWKHNFAYDPNKTYKISFRVRSNTSTATTVYLGVMGIGSDGVAYVNNSGANSTASHAYYALTNGSLAAGAAWTTYTGYIRGVTASAIEQAYNDPNNPGPLHNGVRYFRPAIYVTNAASATFDVDSISVEEVGFTVGIHNFDVAIGGANLLSNSSFEADTDGNGTPDGYTLSSGTGTFSRDNAEQRHGTWSAKYVGAAGVGRQIYQAVALKAGRYTASWKIKRTSVTSNGTNGGTGLDFLAASGNLTIVASSHTATQLGTNQAYLFANGTNAWRDEYLTFDLSADTNVNVYVQAYEGTGGGTTNGGTTWWDSLQLEQGDVATAYAPRPDEILANTITVTEIADDAVTTPKLIAGAVVAGKVAAGAITAEKLTIAAYANENLVPNPSFEDEQQADVTKPAKWSTGYSGSVNSTYAFDSTYKNSGSKGYSIAIASAPTTSSGNIASDAFPVTPGSIYYASMYARSSADITNGFYFRFVFGTTQSFTGEAAPVDIVGNGPLTTSFVLKEGAVTIPSGMTWARCMVYLYQPNVVSTITVDDVSFKRQLRGTTIADGAIVTSHMTADSIAGDRITTNTLNADRIVSDSITTSKLQANAVTAGKLLVTVAGNLNFLNNSSFENLSAKSTSTTPVGWSIAGAAASLVRSATQFSQGGFSGALTANGSGGTMSAVHNAKVGVTPSTTYTFSAYTRANTTVRSARIIIVEYNAAGGVVTTTTGTSSTNSNSAWTRHTQSVTTNASTSSVLVSVEVVSAAASEVHYIDAAQMELGGSATTWVINPIELAPGTIVSDAIVAGSVNADRITAGTITTDLMTANTINGDRITAASLVASKIKAGNIDAETITIGGSDTTTIINGSQTLNDATTTITVSSTATFPSSGIFSIYNGSTFIATISYTGTNSPTNTQFTGCKPSGQNITLAHGWSVKGPGQGATGSRGILKSLSFSPGVAGWYIDQTGNVEFNNAVFRGNVYGSNITGSTITGGLFRTAASGKRVEIKSTNVDTIWLFSGHNSEILAGGIVGGHSGASNSDVAAYPHTTIYSGYLGNALGNSNAYIALNGESANSAISSGIDVFARKVEIRASDDLFLWGGNDGTGNVYVFAGASGKIDFANLLQMNGNPIQGTYNGNAAAIRTVTGTNNATFDWDATNLFFLLKINGTTVASFKQNSSITGGTAKAFVIDHPTDSDKFLAHACIEGPTADVYYRGEGRVSGGHAYIQLPSYFESLTRLENRTVQLTAIDSGGDLYPENLRAGRVSGGGVNVKADSDGPFYWEVKAERSDVDKLVVEPKRSEYNNKGSGPYRWLEKKLMV